MTIPPKTASQIANTPAGNIAATDVQAAINELDTEKSGTGHVHAVGTITGLGTGVATALGINVGSAGAPVVNGGALGTPSGGTLTSCTGLPVSSGISGLGTNVATALAVNIGSAGAPVVLNGALGTASSGTLTNCSGLPDGGLSLTDVTTNNATTSAHGFSPKATAPGSGLLSVLAIGNGETVRSDKALFDTTNPAALGTAAPGTQLIAARRDHVHAIPTVGLPVELVIACSDESTAITTGTSKVSFRMPFAMTLGSGGSGLRANVNTAPTGSTIIIDVNKSGSSLMTTTLLSIATSATTSVGGTPPNITTTSLAADDLITIDFDQVGSTIAGKGLKVIMIGVRA